MTGKKPETQLYVEGVLKQEKMRNEARETVLLSLVSFEVLHLKFV